MVCAVCIHIYSMVNVIPDLISEFELTTHNALRLLQDSGFQTVKDWFQLTESLEVPLDTRRKLNIQAEKCQNYNMALEEGLDWFIANNRNPSWMTLINAVERCNRNVAKTLKSKLKLQGQAKLDFVFSMLQYK